MFRLCETVVCRHSSWLCGCWLYSLYSAFTLEPLLVLGFSVERLIAILRPLQVRRVLFAVMLSNKATSLIKAGTCSEADLR